MPTWREPFWSEAAFAAPRGGDARPASRCSAERPGVVNSCVRFNSSRPRRQSTATPPPPFVEGRATLVNER